MKLTKFFLVAVTLTVPSIYGMQAPAASPAGDKGKMTKSARSASDASPAPTPQDISDATAKGMVWVNTSTKVYHKPGGPSYGTTKHGKFMTEADATKAGFRAAKEPVAKKAKTAK